MTNSAVHVPLLPLSFLLFRLLLLLLLLLFPDLLLILLLLLKLWCLEILKFLSVRGVRASKAASAKLSVVNTSETVSAGDNSFPSSSSDEPEIEFEGKEGRNERGADTWIFSLMVFSSLLFSCWRDGWTADENTLEIAVEGRFWDSEDDGCLSSKPY